MHNVQQPNGIDVYFDWQAAQWKGSQRRYVAEQMVPAFEYAHGYITSVLGLVPTTEVVRPYGTHRRTATRAVSMSPKMIEIYVTGDEVKHRKLAAADREMTGVFVHEMVHGIRETLFPYGHYGLVERIASEGLAYAAQAYAEIDIFDVDHASTVLGDRVDVSGLLEELYDDPYCDTHLHEHPDEEGALQNWFFAKNNLPYSWGQKLGIMCVLEMLEVHGCDFEQLLQMPARDIIAP